MNESHLCRGDRREDSQSDERNGKRDERVLATVLVTLLLRVTFDLDRPTRGLITIPDTP